MALLIFLATIAVTAMFVVTLGGGGRDTVAWSLLGLLVVGALIVLITRPRAGVFAVVDGAIVGLLVGTISIWLQRRRIARSRARDEGGSGSGDS